MKMKTFISFGILFLFSIAGQLMARDKSYVLALTPAVDADLAGDLHGYTRQLIDKLPSDSRLLIVSGDSNPVTIASFVKRDYPNKQVRARELQPINARLEAFFRDGLNRQAGVGGNRLGAIALPEVVEFVRKIAQRPDYLIIAGGTLYENRNPEHSFVADSKADLTLENLRRPSYSMLASPAILTPFATQGIESALKGTTIIYYAPKSSVEILPREFAEEVQAFYGQFFTRQGGNMQPIYADKSSSLASLFADRAPIARVWPNRNETERRMLTIQEIIHGVQIVANRDAITHLYVIDITSSMRQYLEKVGRIISTQLVSKDRRYAVVAFSDYNSPRGSPAYLCTESDSPSEVADAFRAVPLEGSATEEPATGEGLRVAYDLLTRRALTGVEIIIISDTKPKKIDYVLSADEKEPAGGRSDYVVYLDKILKAGHTIKVIACGNDEDAVKWVPSGIKTEKL